MKIEQLLSDKKRFLDLLLLADEQENMIDKYLEHGDVFALYDVNLKSIGVIMKIDDITCELKNIATYKQHQGNGYGSALLKFLFEL